MLRRPLFVDETPGAHLPGDVVYLLPVGLPLEAPWPAEAARDCAALLYRTSFGGREIVLLGRRVARAFHGLSPHLDVLHAAALYSSVYPTVPVPGGGWARCHVWIAPRPGEGERGQLRAFYRRLLGRTEFPDPPSLPAPMPPEAWEALAETRTWPGAGYAPVED